MKMQKIYFDGANHGKIIAIAESGKRFEQDHEQCTMCGEVARVLTPIDGVGPVARKCSCSH